MSTVYFVTGANRGIGLALVTALSSNPSAIVFAGARDPSSATELLKLEKEKKNLHVVKISSGNVEDNEAAVKVIEEKVGKIDVVIANAGIGGTATPIIKTSGSSLLNHVNVNVVGPLILFQSVFPLLTKSTLPTGGKFSIISSLLGSISLQPGEFMSGEYSISKVGANMLIKRIQLEHPDVVALALHPGLVATDMARGATAEMGIDIKDFPGVLTPDQSAADLIKVIDSATKESSGRFYDHAGKELAW